MKQSHITHLMAFTLGGLLFSQVNLFAKDDKANTDQNQVKTNQATPQARMHSGRQATRLTPPEWVTTLPPPGPYQSQLLFPPQQMQMNSGGMSLGNMNQGVMNKDMMNKHHQQMHANSGMQPPVFKQPEWAKPGYVPPRFSQQGQTRPAPEFKQPEWAKPQPDWLKQQPGYRQPNFRHPGMNTGNNPANHAPQFNVPAWARPQPGHMQHRNMKPGFVPPTYASQPPTQANVDQGADQQAVAKNSDSKNKESGINNVMPNRNMAPPMQPFMVPAWQQQYARPPQSLPNQVNPFPWQPQRTAPVMPRNAMPVPPSYRPSYRKPPYMNSNMNPGMNQLRSHPTMRPPYMARSPYTHMLPPVYGPYRPGMQRGYGPRPAYPPLPPRRVR